MRSFLWIPSALALFLAVPQAASAQPLPSPNAPSGLAAQGFLLQGALALGATFPSGDVGGSMLGIRGGLRAGVMLHALSLALDASYGSVSTSTDTTDNYGGIVTFGPRADIFFWRSMDDTVRIFGLVGVDFGDVITKSSTTVAGHTVTASDDTFAAGLELGAGGYYFLHPNFVLGLELGSQTAFIGASNPDILSGFFAALTLGFVAGS